MLATSIKRLNKYDYYAEKFQIAYAFLKRENLSQLPEGPIELGHGVTAYVQHYVTTPSKQLRFETHERFFDVQYLISGEERIGIAARKDLIPIGTYDAEKEISYYEEPEHCGELLLCEGNFVIVAPEEAHKPRCAAGKPCAVKKIVVKVPV